MADKGALKPAFYEDVRSIWQENKAKDAKKSGIDPEDQNLHSLASMAGWEILRKHINNLKIGLDKRLAESVLKSSPVEQIKTDALFSVLGKELLDSIINKVEDSALIVEEITNEQAETRK